jgi:hypothetical protein
MTPCPKPALCRTYRPCHTRPLPYCLSRCAHDCCFCSSCQESCYLCSLRAITSAAPGWWQVQHCSLIVPVFLMWHPTNRHVVSLPPTTVSVRTHMHACMGITVAPPMFEHTRPTIFRARCHHAVSDHSKWRGLGRNRRGFQGHAYSFLSPLFCTCFTLDRAVKQAQRPHKRNARADTITTT